MSLPFTWEPMHVRLERVNGTDLDVVNAARRSFGTKSTWADFGNRILRDADINLLEFLGRGFSSKDFNELLGDIAKAGNEFHKLSFLDLIEESEYLKTRETLINAMWRWRDEAIHDTPFNHVGAHFSIMIPIFVARQLVKTEYMPWSEISRRYKEGEISYWKPGLDDGLHWRAAPETKKQGSGNNLSEQLQHDMNMLVITNTTDSHYRFLYMLEYGGVCMEQARMLLPANLMVEVTWSGFLGAICKMLRERTGSHAQKETQWVAKQMLSLLKLQFPYSIQALIR